MAWLGLGSALAAHGQPQPPEPTLRQAFEAAWALSPQARAASQRDAQAQAQQQASESPLAAPPSITLAHRTDRVGTNAGLREFEAELGLPIRVHGTQDAARRQAHAERQAVAAQLEAARLRLAGEVREHAASLALARVEHELAARQRDEALALAADIERRVRAGESARIESLTALALVRQADAAVLTATGELQRREQVWRSLTGIDRAAPLDESNSVAASATATPAAGPAATSRIESTPQVPSLDAHALVREADAQLAAAQARLGLAEADRRDPMELGVGLIRERSAWGAAADTSLRLALRIPLGGAQRNAARLAGARAELDAAQADADARRRQVPGEITSARAQLEAARGALQQASERARLSREAHALVLKAYQLGESDLPTRLRAEAERRAADSALARTGIDLARAVSQLNQALGLLP